MRREVIQLKIQIRKIEEARLTSKCPVDACA